MNVSLNEADHENIMCPHGAAFSPAWGKIIHKESISNLLKYSHFLFHQPQLRIARKVKDLMDAETELAVLFRPS